MSLTKISYSMIDGAVLNVNDFGADPTGVADSAPAFRAAFAAGLSVFIPEGEYRLASLDSSVTYCDAIFNLNTSRATIQGTRNSRLICDIACETVFLLGNNTPYGMQNSTFSLLYFNGQNLAERFMWGSNPTGESAVNTSTISEMWVLSTTNAAFEIDGFMNVFSNIQCQSGSGIGFYFGDRTAGSKITTSTTVQSCYVQGNNYTSAYKAGIITYSNFHSCAADGTIDIVYDISYANGVSFINCGTEGGLRFFGGPNSNNSGELVNAQFIGCTGGPIGGVSSSTYLINLYRFKDVTFQGCRFNTSGRLTDGIIYVDPINKTAPGDSSGLMFLDRSLSVNNIANAFAFKSPVFFNYLDFSNNLGGEVSVTVTNSAELNEQLYDAMRRVERKVNIVCDAATYEVDLKTIDTVLSSQQINGYKKKQFLEIQISSSSGVASDVIIHANGTYSDSLAFANLKKLTLSNITLRAASTNGASRWLSLSDIDNVIIDGVVFDGTWSGSSRQRSNICNASNCNIFVKGGNIINVSSYSYFYGKGFAPDAETSVTLTEFASIPSGYGSENLTTILTDGTVKYWNNSTNAWV